MSKFSNPEKIRIIIQKRLRGVSVSDIAADMGISRAYVYSVLERLPRPEAGWKPESPKRLPEDRELAIIMDYLAAYPSVQRAAAFGKEETDKAVAQAVAIQYNLPFEQIMEILCQITAFHPMAVEYPLYRSIESWKNRNLVTMRELARYAGLSPQKLNRILNGLEHMPLKTAQRIRDMSGLSIYEIYRTLLEIDEENASNEQKRE